MDSVGELETVPAPYVGGDTAEVLRSMGYSGEEIAAMEEKGAIVCAK